MPDPGIELIDDEMKRKRHDAIKICAMQEQMRAKYGVMQGSVELIREDHER